MKGLRVVVGGFLGLLRGGGVTWDYVQYPVGFAGLGCDVYYVEDTRLWPVYQEDHPEGSDCSSNVAYLASVMEAFGLAGRWCYVDEVTGQHFGLSKPRIREICRSADVFVNVSCSTVMRDEYQNIPVRVLIDSDPMFTQIQYQRQVSFTPGQSKLRQLVDAHTHHFTFGENLGAPDCRVPDCGIAWRTTRQPICLPYWRVRPLPAKSRRAFTTVMNWSAGKPLEYAGEFWGQKDVEFSRFIQLPRAADGPRLKVVLGQTGGFEVPVSLLRKHGWQVLYGNQHVPDWRSYRRFIEHSLAEFSVAKETYVKGRTGWFSCRSACYLAAGRPVVTQETGWSRNLPPGHGLFQFSSVEEALDALQEVWAQPLKHSRAARALAEEHFDSSQVLSALLNALGSISFRVSSVASTRGITD